MLAQSALLLWVAISVALFATLSPLRAFLLTYVVGLLFLPVEVYRDGHYLGSIAFTQSLRIEKFVACNLGALLGTLCFAPQIFRRYRFHWVDAALGIVVVGEFCSSLINGLGAKDGLSVAMDGARDYVPLIILARVHLASVGEVYEAMRTVIAAALVYSLICAVEWRFSPQMHNYVYGYFQHSFDQFMRDQHFRPAGFLRHAIEVSTFMGMSSALAAWLWYKNLLHPLWGFVPAWMIVPALLIGLLCTMTVSGRGEFLVCAALLALFSLTGSRWLLCVLPVICVLCMAGRYTQVIDDTFLTRTASYFVQPARVESLKYRLDAERLNLGSVASRLLLGKGPQNAFVRDAKGHIVTAVDAWWVLQITFFGIVGLAGWCAIWCACIWETLRRWQNLTPDLQTIAAPVCILVGAELADFLFNSFPSMWLLMLQVGLVGALQHYEPATSLESMTVPDEDGPAEELVLL